MYGKLFTNCPFVRRLKNRKKKKKKIIVFKKRNIKGEKKFHQYYSIHLTIFQPKHRSYFQPISNNLPKSWNEMQESTIFFEISKNHLCLLIILIPTKVSNIHMSMLLIIVNCFSKEFQFPPHRLEKRWRLLGRTKSCMLIHISFCIPWLSFVNKRS